MEIYEYTLIAASPSFLFLFVFHGIMIAIYFHYWKGKLQDLVDFFIFNVFPGVLKTKRDDSNNTKVYFRKEKVLLQGETLLQVKKALLFIFGPLLFLIVIEIGPLSFLEYSFDCKDVAQGKDCFEYPITSVFDAVRANCSDPDILQGKKLVLCYRLVFQFEYAVGVSYGMYKICTVLLSVLSALILKINKKRIKRFKIVASIFWVGILVTLLVLALVFQSHSLFLRFSIGKIELILDVFLVITTSCSFITYMPWKKIIQQKTKQGKSEDEIPVIYSMVQQRELLETERLINV